MVRSCCPTSLVSMHSKKQCSRLAEIWTWQNLQFGLEFGKILASLISVGSRRCKSFQRKEEASDPIPLILERLQLISQSLSGEASSDLDLMYSPGWSIGSIMVISFSTNTLYHSAVVMVVTFRGVLSLTHLIESKN